MRMKYIEEQFYGHCDLFDLPESVISMKYHLMTEIIYRFALRASQDVVDECYYGTIKTVLREYDNTDYADLFKDQAEHEGADELQSLRIEVDNLNYELKRLRKRMGGDKSLAETIDKQIEKNKVKARQNLVLVNKVEKIVSLFDTLRFIVLGMHDNEDSELYKKQNDAFNRTIETAKHIRG